MSDKEKSAVGGHKDSTSAAIAPTTSSTVIPTAPAVPVPVAPVASTAPAIPVVPTAPNPAAAAPITTPVPTAVPSYTIPQLQAAMGPLLDAGKAPQLQQLVQSFGVQTIMEIPPERYGEFANGIRSLGGAL
ncbi:MAG: hypothetical protein IJ192_15360 [Clostridia bacterium]|nr:hypothetical protein [Clostridia bacterium]